MSFANTSVTDILATTIENRSKTVADNVTNNNALLDRLKRKGNIKSGLLINAFLYNLDRIIDAIGRKLSKF